MVLVLVPGARGNGLVVLVLMMLVVGVPVVVRHRLVRVGVLMPLAIAPLVLGPPECGQRSPQEGSLGTRIDPTESEPDQGRCPPSTPLTPGQVDRSGREPDSSHGSSRTRSQPPLPHFDRIAAIVMATAEKTASDGEVETRPVACCGEHERQSVSRSGLRSPFSSYGWSPPCFSNTRGAVRKGILRETMPTFSSVCARLSFVAAAG